VSGKMVLVICALAALILAIVVGPGYLFCGLLQGCPGSHGRSSLAYGLEPLFGYDLGLKTAHLIDLTPFTITLAIGVIAAFMVKKNHENEDIAVTLMAMNTCAGCNATAARSDYLTKVEGKGFLCDKCRSLSF
jgi:hypothetical protein